MKNWLILITAIVMVSSCSNGSEADNTLKSKEHNGEVRLPIASRIEKYGDFDSAAVAEIVTEGVLVSSEEYCFVGDKQIGSNLLEMTGSQPVVLIFMPDGTGRKCWIDEPMLYDGEWLYRDFEWSYDIGTRELTTLMFGTIRYVATVRAVDNDGLIFDGVLCEKPFMSGLDTQDYFLRYAMDRRDATVRDSYLERCRNVADFE